MQGSGSKMEKEEGSGGSSEGMPCSYGCEGDDSAVIRWCIPCKRYAALAMHMRSGAGVPRVGVRRLLPCMCPHAVRACASLILTTDSHVCIAGVQGYVRLLCHDARATGQVSEH